MVEYDDEYATCARTYATLCVYPPAEVDPAEVTARLGLEPTSSQRRGELRPPPSRRAPPRAWSCSAWFLTSDGAIESRDGRCHVDWLLDRVGHRALTLAELRTVGCETLLSCYWVSASGHGGPMLSPEQLGRLAECGLEVWFDVYFTSRVGAV